jgi:translation initiation factor IF-2
MVSLVIKRHTLDSDFDSLLGTISSLKNQKKDVSEMRKGNECGISVEGWDAFQEGDQLQCYDETEEKRHL